MPRFEVIANSIKVTPYTVHAPMEFANPSTILEMVENWNESQNEPKQNPLVHAVEKGSYYTIFQMLKDGYSANSCNGEAINLACSKGHFNILKLLHSKGGNICPEEGTPLYNACKNGHYKIIEYLIKNGAASSNTSTKPLEVACSKGFLKTTTLLLKHKVNPKANNNKAFIEACVGGNTQIVTMLLKRGVNANIRDGHALIAAVDGGHVRVVILLTKNETVDKVYWDAAFSLACKYGRLECVKAFVEAGFDIMKCKQEDLDFAESSGHHITVKYIKAEMHLANK